MTRTADVVVIGAGVIGCSVAWELARRGVAVEVLDARDVAHGATAASAGALTPFIQGHPAGVLRDVGYRSLLLFDRFVQDVVAASGCAVEYRRDGTLEVAIGGASWARLQSSAATLPDEAVAELLDGDGARRREPSLTTDVAGAVFIAVHGYVAARELTIALAHAGGRSGVRLRRGTIVDTVDTRPGSAVVRTREGDLACGHVVVAAGSWAGQIAGVDVPVRPVRGQLLKLRWNAEPLRHVLWASRCYVVPWVDGTVLVGATVEDVGFDERATVAGVRDLLDAACELVPHAWIAEFAEVRVGLRPATPDDLPILGRSPASPHIVYATGHYRNGVLLAPLTSAVIADLIVSGREDPTLRALSPSRFCKPD